MAQLYSAPEYARNDQWIHFSRIFHLSTYGQCSTPVALNEKQTSLTQRFDMDDESQNWELKNIRRAFLIRLKTTSDLTSTEEAELGILQDEACQRAKAKHALPFSTPEALETLIREHKG